MISFFVVVVEVGPKVPRVLCRGSKRSPGWVNGGFGQPAWPSFESSPPSVFGALRRRRLRPSTSTKSDQRICREEVGLF